MNWQSFGAIARRRMDEAPDESPPDDEDAFVHESAQASLRVPPTELHLGPTQWGEGKHLCAKKDGFSLHAARTVDAHDRAGLERLCRYGLRSPFSKDRLSIDPDGLVRYRLYRPWPNPAGRTSIVMDPLAFLRRLAALIPAPYSNLVRYHGVFANRSRFRKLLPPPPAFITDAEDERGDEDTGIREFVRPFQDAGLRVVRAPS